MTEPTATEVKKECGDVGAVIVAAGMSSRMGKFKPMLPIGGISFTHRVIDTFRQAGVGPVVLVTGNRADELEDHVAGLHVTCIRNPDYAATQMFDSAKLGLTALRGKCRRVLFTPVDIPLFQVDTVRRLLASQAPYAVPVCGGRQGHPILLSMELVDAIVSHDGTKGLLGALAPYTAEKVSVEDAGILRDADTPEEFEILRNMFQGKRP